MRALFLFFLIGYFGFSQAQIQSTSGIFLFDKDIDTLSANEMEKLNAYAAELSQSDRYKEIFIYGHTDNDGSWAYNEDLAKRRASFVYRQLKSRLPQHFYISIDAFGERMPANNNINESQKSLNRRVQVLAKHYNFQNGKDILQALDLTYQQSFSVPANENKTITTATGSVFTFANNIFNLPKDAPANALVDIKITEINGWKEAMTNNIVYESNGKQLESGGMFHIEASYQQKPVELKQGKTFNVQIPTTKVYNDMEVFTGARDSAGTISWTPVQQRFNNKTIVISRSERLKQDSSIIQNWKLYPSLENSIQTPLLKIAPMPKIPRKPYKPIYPNKKALENLTFNPQKLSEKKLKIKKQALTEQFEKRLNIYNLKMEKYLQDSAKYALNMKLYNDSLDAYITSLDASREDLRRYLNAIYESRIVEEWPKIKNYLIAQNDQKGIRYYDKLYLVNQYFYSIRNNPNITYEKNIINPSFL